MTNRVCTVVPIEVLAKAQELLPDVVISTFEQCTWLAELDFLQLAIALQCSALTRGGYDGRSFELVFAIADSLESYQGWDFR